MKALSQQLSVQPVSWEGFFRAWVTRSSHIVILAAVHEFLKNRIVFACAFAACIGGEPETISIMRLVCHTILTNQERSRRFLVWREPRFDLDHLGDAPVLANLSRDR